MGKNTKRTKEFIESIPDSKLDGLPSTGGTLYNDTDFRLDMQGVSLYISVHLPKLIHRCRWRARIPSVTIFRFRSTSRRLLPRSKRQHHKQLLLFSWRRMILQLLLISGLAWSRVFLFSDRKVKSMYTSWSSWEQHWRIYRNLLTSIDEWQKQTLWFLL